MVLTFFAVVPCTHSQEAASVALPASEATAKASVRAVPGPEPVQDLDVAGTGQPEPASPSRHAKACNVVCNGSSSLSCAASLSGQFAHDPAEVLVQTQGAVCGGGSADGDTSGGGSAAMYSDAASQLQRDGNTADAMAAHEHALAVQTHAGDRSAMCHTLLGMAILHKRTGQLEAASQLYARALALLGDGAEECSPAELTQWQAQRGDVLGGLACVQQRQGRLEEALATHRQALALKLGALGGEHSSVGFTLGEAPMPN